MILKEAINDSSFESHISAAETDKVRAVEDAIAKIMWAWFDKNLDRKITSIKFWFISRTIFVRDLRAVFVALFGPHLTN